MAKHARDRRAASSAAPPARGELGPDAAPRATNLAYLPALDGIRGAGMLSILGVHAGVYLTSGGFYLLDSFFALSGFLITSLLIAEWRQRGMIRLGTFWIRRAKRLLPGLFTMLIGVSVLFAILVPAGTYPTLRGDALASLFYFANWHFIFAGSNYFNQTGLTSPLIHMWSLAVEEQFYLVWPLVFFAVVTIWRSLRVLLAVCIVGTVASAVEMAVLYNGTNATRVYFGTDTHAQSVLVGAGLAVGLAMWAERRSGSARGAWEVTSSRARAVLITLGVAGFAGSVAMYLRVSASEEFAYRGGFLIASLAACAVLLSVSCVQRSFVSRAFGFWPIAYVGRISYGMYLWHFPLFSYVNHARTGLSGWPLFGVRVGPTIAIAVISFHLIERPIRTGTFLSARRLGFALPPAVVLVTVSVLAGTVGPAVSAVSGPGAQTPLAATAIGSVVPDVSYPVRVLLVGDSQALTLGFGLSEAIAAHPGRYEMSLLDEGILGCGVAQGTTYTNRGQPGAILGYPCMPDPSRALCPPGGPFGGNPNARCQEWPAAWRDWVAEFKPNVVVLLAGGSEVYDRVYRGHTTNILSAPFAAYVKSELEKAVRIATSQGALMVLMSAPCFDHGEQPDGAAWPEDSPARVAAYNSLLAQVAGEHPGTVYEQNLHSYVCPGNRYTEAIDGVQIRQSDGVHFALGPGVGGDYLAPAILPYWEELGHLQELKTGGTSIERGALPRSYAPP